MAASGFCGVSSVKLYSVAYLLMERLMKSDTFKTLLYIKHEKTNQELKTKDYDFLIDSLPLYLQSILC